MKRRGSWLSCCTGCTGDSAVVDDGNDSQSEVELGGRVAPEPGKRRGEGSRASSSASGGSKFLRLAPDNPWLVCRSAEHNGKLFWMHEQTQETTWRQPLPRLAPLPSWPDVDASMQQNSFAVVDQHFFGAPADPNDPKARTGICGVAPSVEALHKTTATLSSEHCLYPRRFLEAVGVRRYVLCEELKYNGQRRRDVPDLASGTLYIDVGDRAVRRKRHSFHHELWHMVDFHLLGNAFESHDAEWSEHNPADFRYGHGGKHMRTDSSSSQLASAPHEAFLNRYSTSSIAEDKAEIWAVLMCYQEVLKSPALHAKAGLLKKRARGICDEINDEWWERVVQQQRLKTDHWEVHYVDAQRGKPYWCNWVTEEKTYTKPAGSAAVA